MHFLKRYPVFVLLLPLFFVVHGVGENYGSVAAADALWLILVYAAAALVTAGAGWLLFRDCTKASLLAFALMGYHFFFGVLQDGLRASFAGTFVARYSFILPVSFLFFAVLIWVLKRTKNTLRPLSAYLNLLLLVLLSVEAATMGSYGFRTKATAAAAPQLGLTACDACSRPDLYFIILDGYSGNRALKEGFGFDNTAFEEALRRRGFYVAANGRSNYNYTPFSIASMLNMSYLDLDMKAKGAGNLDYCYRQIRNSRVLNFLQHQGYALCNYSIFDFKGQPALSSDHFLPTRTRLLTSRTFLGRLWKDVLFNIRTGAWRFRPLEEKVVYSHLHNNRLYTRLTLEQATRRDTAPKFVYTHLMMPHYPYYFDRHGRPLPFDSLVEGQQKSKTNYVEYLQYCNRQILRLTDSIIKASTNPPIIVLAGDHGFRDFPDKKDRRHCFSTLTAVYLPSGNYQQFYNDLSGVNLFTAVFNSQFGQHFPLQKDSTTYLWE
jgi:hypothetical protein